MTAPRLLILLLILVTTSLAAQARTVYIDDTLYAPVRSGEGTQYRILHNGLRSGTKVELLEQAESGYSRIRTPSGIEGWVVTRYLSEQPIAQDRLDAAQRELENTKTRLTDVRAQLETAVSERDQLTEERDRLESRSAELAQELKRIREISADSLKLNTRNKELEEANQKLRNELEVMTAENERLEAGKESDFMLLGAGLLILGMILALVVPALKPSRKNDNWA